MARFISGCQGNQNQETTRLGRQWINAFARGWKSGVEISGFRNHDYGDKDGDDTFHVTMNSGSDDMRAGSINIGTVTVSKNGDVVFTPYKRGRITLKARKS